MSKWQRLFTLLEKEWTEFFASKAWIIVLILPLFIGFLYGVVYQKAENKQFLLAYSADLPTQFQQILKNPRLKLVQYTDINQAKTDLLRDKLDGILITPAPGSQQVQLLVSQTEAQATALLADTINVAMLQAFHPNKIPQVKLTVLNPSNSSRWISLPTWLIQVILMICLLQAAAAVADEKERQTLHSLLVSPMTFGEYVTAKLMWNTLVGVAAVSATLLLTSPQLNFGIVFIFAMIGSLVFSAMATLIGIASPNPLFARTVATLGYITSSIPIMIRDLPFAGKEFLNLFPSLLVLLGLEGSVTTHPLLGELVSYGLILTVEAGLLYGVTYYILKYKLDF